MIQRYACLHMNHSTWLQHVKQFYEAWIAICRDCGCDDGTARTLWSRHMQLPVMIERQAGGVVRHSWPGDSSIALVTDTSRSVE